MSNFAEQSPSAPGTLYSPKPPTTAATPIAIAAEAYPATSMIPGGGDPKETAEVVGHWAEPGSSASIGGFNEDRVNRQIQSGKDGQRAAALRAVVSKMKADGRDLTPLDGGRAIEYDPAFKGNGKIWRQNPPAALIGSEAMIEDWKRLQLIVEHELVHAQQYLAPNAAEMSHVEREFLANAREFELADELGLREPEREYNLLDAQEKLTGWYTHLQPEKQAEHKSTYDRCMAMKLQPT